MTIPTVRFAAPLAAVLLALLGVVSVSAQQRSGEAAPRTEATSAAANAAAANKAPARPVLLVTPEREAAALTFVRMHHAELDDLLALLKKEQPAEYERAVRELFRTSERLAQWSERDPERHELEVELWKARSRIQLLSARLHMGESAALRRELKDALLRRIDVQVEIHSRERAKLAERLDKLDQQLTELTSGREQMVDEQLRTLAPKPVAAKPTPAKPNAKPVDAKPTDAKPTDAKPTDAKPTDAKPTDAKPTDKARPAPNKPM